MSKELKKIKVSAIALTGSPAVKTSKLRLRKSAEPNRLADVVERLMKGGLSTIEEIKKELDEEGIDKILEALKTIETYKNDLPDDLENSVEILITAIKELAPDEEKSEEEEEEDEEEEEEKSSKPLDDIEEMDPRVRLRLEALEKSEEEEDEMPEFSRLVEAVQKQIPEKVKGPGNEMVQDVERLKRIKKNMLDPGESSEKNPMPKFFALMDFMDATEYPEKYMIKKSELEKQKESEKDDQDFEEIPKKKSIDDPGGLRIEKVEKEDDGGFAEKFPTLNEAWGIFDELRGED